MSVLITKQILRAVEPNIPDDKAVLFFDLLNQEMAKNGINKYKLRAAAFLANVIHESSNLTRLIESFNYKDPARLVLIFPNDFKSIADARAVHAKGRAAIANRVYANQNGNGNEASGDGFRYCGRSLMMITGRANYLVCQQSTGLKVIDHPELLEDPKNAVVAARDFWHRHNLNVPADNADFLKVCKIINGGKIGLTERTIIYRRAIKVLGG